MGRTISFQEEALIKLVSGKRNQNVIIEFGKRIVSTYRVIFPKKSKSITRRFQVKTVYPGVVPTHKQWNEDFFVSTQFLNGENTGVKLYV